MVQCLPENDALGKGFVKNVCKFSQHPAYHSKSVSLRYKEVCHYFEYQIRRFFKQQNPRWGSNDQQQCLFNIHLESSFPSWKSTKESMKKVSPTWWLLRTVPVRNTGWHSPGLSCLGAYVYELSYKIGSGDGEGTLYFSLKDGLYSAVFSIPSHEPDLQDLPWIKSSKASTLTEESWGCSYLLFVLCISPFRSP